MMLARVCRSGISPQVTTLLKSPVVPRVPKVQALRLQHQNASGGGFARSRRAGIMEKAMAPATGKAFDVGRAMVAGASVFGLGGLCYYGLGLSPQAGAIDNASMWPEYVKERIRTTYMYLGGSVVAGGLGAVACMRSPAMMNMFMGNSGLALCASIAAMIGTAMVARSIPYQPGFGAKQAAWLVHVGVIGASVAPMALFAGPLVVRAAWYTAAIVGGLSTVAVCAPSDKFLNMGGPLAIGLGVVAASSIGTFFLPPTTALGSGLHSMALYGGLILFSMFVMYDTQRIIKQAQTYPRHNGIYGVRPYDPINNAMSLYVDTVNIFVRIIWMLMSGKRNK